MHRRVIYQALAWVPIAAGSANLAFATTSAQINNKTVIYEDSTTYAQTPVAVETVTTDKWYQPLATPTRRKVDVVNRQNVAINFPVAPTITMDMWWRQLDPPVRRKTVTAEEGSLFAAPYQPVVAETVTVDKWYRGLDVPVRSRSSLYSLQHLSYGGIPIAAAAAPGDATLAFATTSTQIINKTIVYEPDAYTPFTPAAAVEVVTVDKWWRQLDAPVRLRIAVNPGLYSIAPPKPEANDQIAWFRQLELPTRRKWVVEGLRSASPPKPEANDAIGWYAPLGEPQRLKRLQAGIHQFEARGAFPQVPWGWYARLDEPARIKVKPTTQIGLTFVAAAPGSGVAYNWFSQLDEPLRIRRTPKTDVSWSTYTPPVVVAETVTIDKWWRELVRPTLRARHVPQVSWAASPQFVNLGTSTLAATTTSAMVIRRAFLYEPVAFGSYVTPAAVFFPGDATLSFSTDSAQVFTRTIIYEPDAYTAYVLAAAPGPGVAYDWFQPIDRPTRRTRPVPQQMGYTFVAAAPGRGVAYNWFAPLDTPMRRDHRRVARQMADTTLPAIRLAVTYQQAVTIEVTVGFNRLGRFICKAEVEDGAVEQAEQSDPWVTQAELSEDFTDVSEQSDPWSTQQETDDTSEEEDPNPQSGCT